MEKTLVATIKLDSGVVSYLSMLQYDVNGLRALNSHIIRAGNYDADTYANFMEKYKAANREYNVAFSEIIHEAAAEYLKPGYSFEISFLMETLLIYKEGND